MTSTRPGASGTPRPGPLRVLDGGRMVAEPARLPVLRALGLDTVDAVMEFRGGRVLRTTPLGDNVVVDLPAGGRMYLKRFRYRGVRLALREFLKGRLRLPSALDEWWTVRELAGAGIPVVPAVAAGDGSRQGEHRSFFCSLELEGHEPADDALRRGLRPTGAAVRALAGLVARMHEAGWQHRDLYLCHVFVDPAWQPVILDLARALRRPVLSMRRRVKDLASLQYSSLDTPLSDRDRLRFLRAYLGGRRLGRPGRGWLRRVAAKTRRIARHDAHKAARRRDSAAQPTP